MFTLTSTLMLTPVHRSRLQHAVRTRRIDPADLISAILAGTQPHPIDAQAAHERVLAVPIRVYLTAEQRDMLLLYAQQHSAQVSELISQIVAEFLQELDDPTTAPESPAQPHEQSGYRRELLRLRAHRANLGRRSPSWLDRYIADLEAFLDLQAD
jgi:hypothetical protein